MSDQPNWAEAAAAKAEMKARILETYDASIDAGFMRDEIIAGIMEMFSDDQRFLRGIVRMWIDTERPE